MRTKTALMSFFACLLTAEFGTAQDDKLSRQSLKGLAGVRIGVERLSPEAEQGGLSKTALEADVELKLRLAGIPALSRDEHLAAAGSPHLSIRVTAMTIPTRGGSGASLGYAAAIEVSLRQDVSLERAPASRIAAAVTWSRFWLITARPDNLRDVVHLYVNNLVDQFIKAYLAVNPKR